MPKIKVYKVRMYNVMTDEFVSSRRMATREGAVVMRGEILEDTGVEIDSSRLENAEQWTPKDFAP